MLLVTLWPGNFTSLYLDLRNASKKVSMNLLNSFVKYYRKDIEKQYLRILILLILSDKSVYWNFFLPFFLFKHPKYFLLLNLIPISPFCDSKSVCLWKYGTSLLYNIDFMMKYLNFQVAHVLYFAVQSETTENCQFEKWENVSSYLFYALSVWNF